jgi:hypothetical protein
MKRTFATALFAILFVSSCVFALPAQDGVASGPRLHPRQEAPQQAPDEQLLPPNSDATVGPPNRKEYPQKYSSIYMPISLAEGRIRTAEFPVVKRSQWYDVMLQVEKPLPLRRMKCMVGVMSGPLEEKEDCEGRDPAVRADWTVWEGGQIVHWGSIPDYGAGIFTKDNIFKQIGSFPLEAGKKYVVQVHFIKDGSALNVANPHLIVIPHKDMW